MNAASINAGTIPTGDLAPLTPADGIWFMVFCDSGHLKARREILGHPRWRTRLLKDAGVEPTCGRSASLVGPLMRAVVRKQERRRRRARRLLREDPWLLDLRHRAVHGERGDLVIYSAVLRALYVGAIS